MKYTQHITASHAYVVVFPREKYIIFLASLRHNINGWDKSSKLTRCTKWRYIVFEIIALFLLTAFSCELFNVSVDCWFSWASKLSWDEFWLIFRRKFWIKIGIIRSKILQFFELVQIFVKIIPKFRKTLNQFWNISRQSKVDSKSIQMLTKN